MRFSWRDLSKGTRPFQTVAGRSVTGASRMALIEP